jgi:hypothetical protein
VEILRHELLIDNENRCRVRRIGPRERAALDKRNSQCFQVVGAEGVNDYREGLAIGRGITAHFGATPIAAA